MEVLKRIGIIFFLASIFLCPNHILAQDLLIDVKGKVSDQLNGIPLSGANIVIIGSEQKGTITTEDGAFTLQLKPGYYTFKISYVGYKSLILPEYLVTSSNKTYISVELLESAIPLEDVQVNSSFLPIQLDKRVITVEQTQRYAATFYDPVRLSVSLPAVNSTNDQNNNVSVRGVSPSYNQWRLEGVEVASPNHLSNAGTFSDRPTLNGGGVNILSAQVLENSKVVFGGFDPTYSNVLGGVFDNNLRRGNFSKAKHTGQISLLGFDFSTEGPFSQHSNSSYLVNYRYSFTGLLANLGVDFGGEEIQFQDLSFNLYFPYKKGFFKFFGTGGVSSNDFTGVDSLNEAEEEKDLSDIRFDGTVLAVGLKNVHKIGGNFSLNNTLIYSFNHTDRQEDQELFSNNALTALFSDESNKINKLSFQTKLEVGFENADILEIGYNAVFNEYKVTNEVRQTISNTVINLFATEQQEWILSPFVNYKANIGDRFLYELGLNVSNYNLVDEVLIEPRVYVQKYFGNKGTSIYARLGKYSQSQNPNTKLFLESNPSINGSNRQLGPTSSGNLQLGYLANYKKHNVNVEAFYNRYSNVPTVSNTLPIQFVSDLFSSFNFDNQRISFPIGDLRDARVIGIELSAEKRLSNNLYYLIGGTLYDSKYEDVLGNWQSSRWDGEFAFNATLGKEFVLKSKNDKIRNFSLNGRIIYQGGFRSTPLLEENSIAFQREVFDGSNPLSFKEPNYFRLDLRLAWRVQKENYTRTISIDLQNATNYENFAFEQFDIVTGRIERRKQLGIIPLLTYRVEF